MNTNIKLFLSKILNLLHGLLLLFPIVIYLFKIPKKKSFMFSVYKYTIIIMLLVPLHWIFFENQCISTMLSKNLGDYQDSQTTSEFSENNLKWLYLPIMNLIGWKWNSDGLGKMITLHWIFNFILLWNFIFNKLL